MVEKQGKRGAFMACDQYPACGHTENVQKEEKVVDHRTKEFHLTVEECRARALECAIKCSSTSNTSDLLTKAKIFEVYIRG